MRLRNMQNPTPLELAGAVDSYWDAQLIKQETEAAARDARVADMVTYYLDEGWPSVMERIWETEECIGEEYAFDTLLKQLVAARVNRLQDPSMLVAAKRLADWVVSYVGDMAEDDVEAQ